MELLGLDKMRNISQGRQNGGGEENVAIDIAIIVAGVLFLQNSNQRFEEGCIFVVSSTIKPLSTHITCIGCLLQKTVVRNTFSTGTSR